MIRTVRLIAALMLFAVLAPHEASAAIRLLSWQPTPQHSAFLIAQRDGETESMAVMRYLGAVNAEPDFVALLGRPLNLPIGQLAEIGAEAQISAVLIANDRGDMRPHPIRVNRFRIPLMQNGARVLIVPIGATAGLETADAEDYRSRVSDLADLAVFMGGDDLDPKVFGRENKYSVDVHPEQDKGEISLLDTIVRRAKTFVVGICRGHQLVLSALDRRYVLVQDIVKELHLPSHRETEHPIQVKRTGTNLDLLFSRLPHGEANSLHHQGFINLPKDGPVEVIAKDPNGIVEGTIFKNRMGFTLQFHPEQMSHAVASAFAQAMVAEASRLKQLVTGLSARTARSGSCEALF